MGTPPTLQDFREELLKQNEPEAQEIALAIELFTDGSLNTFAKHTNVDTKSRLICYDIWSLLSPTSSPNSVSERPFGKFVAIGDTFSFGGLPACRFIASNRIL